MFDKDIVMLQVTTCTSLPFLLSIFRICVHVYLAPSEPLNDKEKSQFLWKFFYFLIDSVSLRGNL